MGVHGLTTFLRENKSRLATSISFSTVQKIGRTPLVVDAWSFLYKLFHDSGLPWVYGGEYDAIVELITRIVRSWLAVGLRPIFVFDGPTPPKKSATVLARKNGSQPSQLYFRTSSASRNTRRFLNEARIIPPLIFSACVHALSAFRSQSAANEDGSATKREMRDGTVEYDEVELHFADEEGDPYAVELAGRVHGYVTGLDSDFIVLNSEGYRGYLPVDELLWIREVEEPLVEDDTASGGGGDDGFTTVVKGKSKKRGTLPASKTTMRKGIGERPKTRTVSSIVGNGMIPPEDWDDQCILNASVYKPASLASLFKLPISVLPLIGAFVGNDYTLHGADASSTDSTSSKQGFQRLLFPRSYTLSQRISHTASTLAAFLHPNNAPKASLVPGKRKPSRPPQSALELIQWTVGALMAGGGGPPALMTSGQEELIVEAVVQGTLPYALPLGPPEDAPLDIGICALHEPDECQLAVTLDHLADAPSDSFGGNENVKGILAERYIRSYRAGSFSPLLVDILSTRTFWPEIFLEHPDHEAVARSVSRPIRLISYALLEDGLGLPVFESDFDGEGEQEQQETDEVEDDEHDPDEIIDVVEEHSDEEDVSDYDELSDVARLRGQLLDLQYDNDPLATSSSASVSMESAVMSSEGDESEYQRMLAAVVDVSNGIGVVERRTPEPLDSRRRGESSMAALRKRWPKSKPKALIEYVRRGARVVGEEVEVPSLQQLSQNSSAQTAVQSSLPEGGRDSADTQSSPIQLLPISQRLSSLCSFLSTPITRFESLSSESRMPVLALRHILRRMHARAVDAGHSEEKQAGRWTRREARAFLACLSSPSSAPADMRPPEEVSERSIQLTAQLSTTLEALEHLTQVLFLTSCIPTCSHRFSGSRFHALLSSPASSTDGLRDGPLRVDEEVWTAVEEGLVICFDEERGHDGKRARRKAREAAQLNVMAPGMSRSSSAQSSKMGSVGRSAGSMFALLAGADD